MYLQTKHWPFGPVTWFKVLRQHNHFGVWDSIRYAVWLAYGNESMPPGELRAWMEEQLRKHPWAVRVVFWLWSYLLIVFIAWEITR